MNADLISARRRAAEMAAIFMIGDGVLGLFQPMRHVELWRSRYAPIDIVVRPFRGRPGRRRAYGVIQVALGMALASRLRSETDHDRRRRETRT